MGIDEEHKRFFHTDVDMQRPREGERFACVEHNGRYFLAAGPIVILTPAQARLIDAKSKYGIGAGIIERTLGEQP